MEGAQLAFRLRALTVACTDLERSHRFYVHVLGAALDAASEGYGCPWYWLGRWSITLMPNAAGPSASSFPEHAMAIPWLEVDDLEAARRHFARHEVRVIDPGDGQFLMIADPDGLPIEVWEADGPRLGA